jgi:hypothetical protein
MKKILQPILIALVFAILLIASSYFLKGNPVGDWMDSLIYIAGAYCLFHYYNKISPDCRQRLDSE